ncbi:MAG: hypothetical protein DMG06_00410 [Acidobacteria bacterium]|nr:MAG: hypothetical protein DMG06_00410 [Acidobacteriota bacterium]
MAKSQGFPVSVSEAVTPHILHKASPSPPYHVKHFLNFIQKMARRNEFCSEARFLEFPSMGLRLPVTIWYSNSGIHTDLSLE